MEMILKLIIGATRPSIFYTTTMILPHTTDKYELRILIILRIHLSILKWECLKALKLQWCCTYNSSA